MFQNDAQLKLQLAFRMILFHSGPQIVFGLSSESLQPLKKRVLKVDGLMSSESEAQP